MERLTPLSASFLQAEDEDGLASLAIGSIAVFEPPAPGFEDFVAAIAGRLPALPRYRQKLRMTPFDLAPPAWVDDPGFDLRWHLRNTALPAPGRKAELGRLMSRVMTQRMDRNRPLWEYWFVEGLEDGRWALLSKLHHSMVDGVSGSDIYRLILDATREPMPGLEDVWKPAAPPSTPSLMARAAWDLVSKPVVDARLVGDALRSPLRLARRGARTATGLLAISGALRPASSSSLVGPLDGSRRFTWASTSLVDVRGVGRQLGGSVNDVALTAISGGFRQLLLSRGEKPDAHALRSLVPVSVRAPGQESLRDNRVSIMLPFLPVDIEDPRERLAAVRARIDALRSAGESEAGESLMSLAALGPFPPVSLGVRLAIHIPQRQVVTVTTNVPGPRAPLFALGRQVEQIIPYVPTANRVRLSVAIFSYCDTLAFGITGDYSTVPDIEVLADGISRSVEELVRTAETSL